MNKINGGLVFMKKFGGITGLTHSIVNEYFRSTIHAVISTSSNTQCSIKCEKLDVYIPRQVIYNY